MDIFVSGKFKHCVSSNGIKDERRTKSCREYQLTLVWVLEPFLPCSFDRSTNAWLKLGKEFPDFRHSWHGHGQPPRAARCTVRQPREECNGIYAETYAFFHRTAAAFRAISALRSG